MRTRTLKTIKDGNRLSNGNLQQEKMEMDEVVESLNNEVKILTKMMDES